MTSEKYTITLICLIAARKEIAYQEEIIALNYRTHLGELDYRTMYQTSRRVSPPQGIIGYIALL